MPSAPRRGGRRESQRHLSRVSSCVPCTARLQFPHSAVIHCKGPARSGWPGSSRPQEAGAAASDNQLPEAVPPAFMAPRNWVEPPAGSAGGSVRGGFVGQPRTSGAGGRRNLLDWRTARQWHQMRLGCRTARPYGLVEGPSGHPATEGAGISWFGQHKQRSQ